VVERLATLFGRLYVHLEVFYVVGLADELRQPLRAEDPIEAGVLVRLFGGEGSLARFG
jgi:hypothetical protein